MLFDDGDELSELLEEILSHVLVAGPYHMQERRHHLEGGGGGKGRGRGEVERRGEGGGEG